MAETQERAGASLAGRFATQSDALRMDEITLIGTFSAPTGRGALLRMPSGRITRVEVGDRIRGGRIVAIDAARLDLRRGGRIERLDLPARG